MSCKNIGVGLNTVTQKSVELMVEGKITKEVAIELIRTARNAVGWCDGETEDAVDYILQSRCGCCLEQVEPGKPMYHLWDVNLKYEEKSRLYDETFDFVLAPYLCPECFERVINEFMHDDTAGAAQIRYIEENVELKDRVALEPY